MIVTYLLIVLLSQKPMTFGVVNEYETKTSCREAVQQLDQKIQPAAYCLAIAHETI